MGFPSLKQPFFTQSNDFHHAYNHNAFKCLETLTFSKSLHTDKAMKIYARYSNSKNLREGFYCMREEFAKRYGCSLSWATTLSNRLVIEGLLRKVPQYFPEQQKTVNTFFLTQRSQWLLGQAFDFTEGQEPLTQVPSSVPDGRDEPPIETYDNFVFNESEFSDCVEKKDSNIFNMYVPKPSNQGEKMEKTTTYSEDQALNFEMTRIISDEYVIPKLAGFKPFAKINELVNKAVKEYGYERCIEYFSEFLPFGHKWKKGSTARKINYGLKNYDKIKAEQVEIAKADEQYAKVGQFIFWEWNDYFVSLESDNPLPKPTSECPESMAHNFKEV